MTTLLANLIASAIPADTDAQKVLGLDYTEESAGIPASTIPIDKTFQHRLAVECAEEVFQVKKAKPEEGKKPEEIKKEEIQKITDIMKKYETKIYEKYIQKVPVLTFDKRNAKEDLIHTSIKHNYSGETAFLSDYNQLLRGYKDEGEFQQMLEQQKGFKVKLPKDIDTRYPDNQYSLDKKNYVDTQASSKFYYPQDYQMYYDNMNAYHNKPTSDIANRQKLFMSSQEGMFDPYASQGQGFGNSKQGFRSQGGAAVSQQVVHNPYGEEEDLKLRRTIDLMGGINKTLPNMERSLYDNEFKNIEQNYRYHQNFENTSNKRVNVLLQNPLNDVVGPQFDAPDAIAASPQRGGIANLQKPGLYYSPSKKAYVPVPGQIEFQPMQQMPMQMPQIQPQFNFLAEARDPLGERDVNNIYNPTFSSSQHMREARMGLLNPVSRQNLPAQNFWGNLTS